MFSKFQNHKFTKTPRAGFDFFKNSLWPTVCTFQKKNQNPTQSRFQHSCQDRLSQIRLFIDKLLMSFSLSAEVQAKSLKLTPTRSLWNIPWPEQRSVLTHPPSQVLYCYSTHSHQQRRHCLSSLSDSEWSLCSLKSPCLTSDELRHKNNEILCID